MTKFIAAKKKMTIQFCFFFLAVGNSSFLLLSRGNGSSEVDRGNFNQNQTKEEESWGKSVNDVDDSKDHQLN